MVLALICALVCVCIPTLAFASPDVNVPPADGSLDIDTLISVFKAHQWVAGAAIVIGFLIRLQKAGKLPGFNRIPANYRPFLALGLGIVSGILDKVMVDSKNWRVAILDGVLSAAIAIVGHDTLIEGVRGGKEIMGGGQKNPAPNPVPTSTDALKTAIVYVAGTALLGYVLQACALFTPANVIALDKAACIIENAFLDIPQLNALCGLKTDAEKAAGAKLATEHRAQLAAEMKSRAAVCAPDAGTCCADGGAR